MLRNRHDVPDHVRQARRKVRAKKFFYRHFAIFLASGFFFFSMNVLDNDLYEPWFLYPVISWGTLIVVQYLWTFGFPLTKAGTSEWEARELEREIAKRAPAAVLEAPRDLSLPRTEPVKRSRKVDIDDRLELREVRKSKQPAYRTDDLV